MSCYSSMLIMFSDIVLNFTCKKLYLYQDLGCVAINLFKIENTSVEVEQLLQALELQFYIRSQCKIPYFLVENPWLFQTWLQSLQHSLGLVLCHFGSFQVSRDNCDSIYYAVWALIERPCSEGLRTAWRPRVCSLYLNHWHSSNIEMPLATRSKLAHNAPTVDSELLSQEKHASKRQKTGLGMSWHRSPWSRRV